MYSNQPTAIFFSFSLLIYSYFIDFIWFSEWRKNIFYSKNGFQIKLMVGHSNAKTLFSVQE